jgi:hypothetical protein
VDASRPQRRLHPPAGRSNTTPRRVIFSFIFEFNFNFNNGRDRRKQATVPRELHRQHAAGALQVPVIIIIIIPIILLFYYTAATAVLLYCCTAATTVANSELCAAAAWPRTAAREPAAGRPRNASARCRCVVI